MVANGSERGYRLFEWISRRIWPLAIGALVVAVALAVLTPVVADDGEPSFDPAGEIYDTHEHFVFKGLAGFGTKVESVLERGIRGYRTPQQRDYFTNPQEFR